jgi:uncharacterized protein YegL
MKDNLTEIIAVIDKSGSMQELTSDTIGGFNSFIEEQKKLPGEAIITTVLFDHNYRVLHDRKNLKDIKPITNCDYRAEGNTALLDALGKAMNSVGVKLDKTPEEERPSKVIVVIITDGEENSSKEFTNEKIKEMIDLQKSVYSWEFLFLGANIDSFAVAGNIGINNAVNYSASNIGVQSVYRSVSLACANFRTTGDIRNGADFEKEIVNED